MADRLHFVSSNFLHLNNNIYDSSEFSMTHNLLNSDMLLILKWNILVNISECKLIPWLPNIEISYDTQCTLFASEYPLLTYMATYIISMSRPFTRQNKCSLAVEHKETALIHCLYVLFTPLRYGTYICVTLAGIFSNISHSQFRVEF